MINISKKSSQEIVESLLNNSTRFLQETMPFIKIDDLLEIKNVDILETIFQDILWNSKSIIYLYSNHYYGIKEINYSKRRILFWELFSDSTPIEFNIEDGKLLVIDFNQEIILIWPKWCKVEDIF